MPFCSIDLLCFLVVVLVVVASGDSLVARMVGEVFRCDLCDPCMMLSCAFILVIFFYYSSLYFILVSKDLRAGHYIKSQQNGNFSGEYYNLKGDSIQLQERRVNLVINNSIVFPSN